MKKCVLLLKIFSVAAYSSQITADNNLYGNLFAQQGPFVTNRLSGQLGNQLYQIATGISLALDHNARYILPKLDYPAILNQLPVQQTLLIKHIFNKKINNYDETFNFVPILFQENIQLQGYFLSYKYFDHHKNEITSLFGPSSEIQAYIINKYGDLLINNSTVAIHIRTFFPDYAPWKRQHPKDTSFYKKLPAPNIHYIKEAIAFFPHDALFIVCSDNITWAKKALATLQGNFYFVESEKYYVDFYLMSMCNHNILSNSSFSWWAAYLNTNPDKIVIAPNPYAFDKKRKLEDTYPPDWYLVNRKEDGLIPDFFGNNIFITP